MRRYSSISMKEEEDLEKAKKEASPDGKNSEQTGETGATTDIIMQQIKPGTNDQNQDKAEKKSQAGSEIKVCYM